MLYSGDTQENHESCQIASSTPKVCYAKTSGCSQKAKYPSTTSSPVHPFPTTCQLVARAPRSDLKSDLVRGVSVSARRPHSAGEHLGAGITQPLLQWISGSLAPSKHVEDISYDPRRHPTIITDLATSTLACKGHRNGYSLAHTPTRAVAVDTGPPLSYGDGEIGRRDSVGRASQNAPRRCAWCGTSASHQTYDIARRRLISMDEYCQTTSNVFRTKKVSENTSPKVTIYSKNRKPKHRPKPLDLTFSNKLDHGSTARHTPTVEVPAPVRIQLVTPMTPGTGLSAVSDLLNLAGRVASAWLPARSPDGELVFVDPARDSRGKQVLVASRMTITKGST